MRRLVCALALPNYGSRSHWETVYTTAKTDPWYCGWRELESFWNDVAPRPPARVLVPGVGTDVALLAHLLVTGCVAGWASRQWGCTRRTAPFLPLTEFAPFHRATDGVQCGVCVSSYGVTAYDYVPAAVAAVAERLADGPGALELFVDDATDARRVETGAFDVALDKGTLDAVYLSGRSPNDRRRRLAQAVRELRRALRRDGGVLVSLSRAAPDAVRAALEECGASGGSDDDSSWQCLRDGGFHVASDGAVSTDLGGAALFVYESSLK